jgi:hypothetical protein
MGAEARLRHVLEEYRQVQYVCASPRDRQDRRSYLTGHLPSFRVLFSIFSPRSFTQEVPTRFKKEVARAAAAGGTAGAGGGSPKYHPNLAVSLAGLERIVRNVGGTPRQLSPCEVRTVVSLHGDAASGTISAGRLVQIL